MSQNKVQPVNVETVIRNQDHRFLKKMPRFMINWIKRLVRQDEINAVLLRLQGKKNAAFVKGAMQDLQLSVNPINQDFIPPEGRFIFACNHSLGAVDLGAVLLNLQQKYPKIKVLANEIYLQVEQTRDLFLPVSILKKNDSAKKQAIEDWLAQKDTQFLIFPAGKVARKRKGKLDDGFWHRSFIRNAVEHKRDIIPVFIGGQNSHFFYNFSKIRKFLRIKTNLEFFLLPAEVFKKRGATIPIIFGKPISYKIFDESKTHLEWAQEIKKRTYELEKKYL